MLNLSATEVIVILVLALIVLGPTRLPEAARGVGRAMGELRRLSEGFQSEMRDAVADVQGPTGRTGPPTLPPHPGEVAKWEQKQAASAQPEPEDDDQTTSPNGSEDDPTAPSAAT